jgi:hypothetical protein
MTQVDVERLEKLMDRAGLSEKAKKKLRKENGTPTPATPPRPRQRHATRWSHQALSHGPAKSSHFAGPPAHTVRGFSFL